MATGATTNTDTPLRALRPPMAEDPWPPIPSVLREYEIGNLQWTLRRSYLALLLSRIGAGTPSDATLQEVLARVRDCGALGDLLACSELDEEGRERPSWDFRSEVLKGYYLDEDLNEHTGEPLLLCWEDDDRHNQRTAMEDTEMRFEYSLGPLKQQIFKCRRDGGLVGLATTAAVEGDFVSFRFIMQWIWKVRDEEVDLWPVVHAIGNGSFQGEDDYNAKGLWLSLIWERVVGIEDGFVRTYGGHNRSTFERTLSHMIYYHHTVNGCAHGAQHLCELHEEWAAPRAVQDGCGTSSIVCSPLGVPVA